MRAAPALFSLVALVGLLLLNSPTAYAELVPIDGTHTVTKFCGTVSEATWGMTNYGVTVGQPYVGSFDLVQEQPENPNASTVEWNCETNTYGCGSFHLVVPGYMPPQRVGQSSSSEVDITGPVERVHRSSITYRLMASVDDFVVDMGPAYLGAVGEATATLVCSECPGGNPSLSISPDFRDNINHVHGFLELTVAVPGIGGSLAPPTPPDGEGLEASIDQLGGACNNFLPATSPLGLVALVGLLISSALFVAAPSAR